MPILRSVLAALIAALIVTVACAAPATPPQSGVVTTASGTVRGAVEGGLSSFRGIPHARPPVGELRWAPPQPARHWSGTRDATAAGPACAQEAIQPGATASTAEDCLYLDVARPTAPADRPRPVMVWLHGGGFFGGQGADYDPAPLVSGGDVVVVTVNYRLGAFGFFAHPALGGGGDFGLQDQAAALGWVRDNIAAFGGDPGNVTLFGQSAGAFSTCALATSPRASELFDKAIVQSGSCSVRYPANGLAPGLGEYAPFVALDQVLATGAAWAERFGCSDAACLRALSAERLLASGAMPVFSFPAHGTPLLPEAPTTVMSEGRSADIPMIIGNLIV